MVDKTNSDVERALEAFGGSGLKYRIFGTFSPKPSAHAGANSRASSEDTEGDTFASASQAPTAVTAVAPVTSSSGATGQADTLYPLLGAALPEASVVPVAPAPDQMPRRASPRVIPDEFPAAPAPFSTRQGRPATAYVPPTMPAPSVTVPMAPSPAPRPATPPPAAPPAVAAPVVREVIHPPVIPSAVTPPAPVLPPSPASSLLTETAALPARGAVTTPVAERGWVPPPPAPPEPPPPQVVAPPPPASVPPSLPARVVSDPVEPAAERPPSGPPAQEPAGAAAHTIPLTSLAAHFEPSASSGRGGAGEPEHGRQSGTSEAADRRSLVEMFRILSGGSDSARPVAAPIGRYVDEEPGLFRRL